MEDDSSSLPGDEGAGRNDVEGRINALAAELDLEAFFILRASNDSDRWSGQVGFPGGRQSDADGGSDEATVAREVMEEVGITLPGLRAGAHEETECSESIDSEFEHLGRLYDRVIAPQRGSTLVVSCLVYLQRPRDSSSPSSSSSSTSRSSSAQQLPPALEPTEVAACGWVPIRSLQARDGAVPMILSL